jgi:hypothetical protein
MSPSNPGPSTVVPSSEDQRSSDAQRVGSRRAKGPEARGASVAISAMSRTFAALGFLFLLAFLGSWIDRWLSTSVFLPIGGVVGSLLAVIGLVYTVKVAEIEARRQREAQRESAPMPVSSESSDHPAT